MGEGGDSDCIAEGTTAAREQRRVALPLWQPRRVPWQLSTQFEEFSRCLGTLEPAGKAADCPGRPARHRRCCSTAWEGRAVLPLVWRPRGALRQCLCTPQPWPCCHRALERSGAHVGEGGDSDCIAEGTTAAREQRRVALPLSQPRRVPWQLSTQFEEFSRCLGTLQPAGKAADCPGRPARRRRCCSTAWEGRAVLPLVWRPRGALRQCVCTPQPWPCCHRALERSGAHVGEGGDSDCIAEGTTAARAAAESRPASVAAPACPLAALHPVRGVFEVSGHPPAGREGG